MPDPIWLDTNTLSFALKGDPGINLQLSKLRQGGRQLLVTQQVEIEILFGNIFTLKQNKAFLAQTPPPEFREYVRKGMKKVGVTIDTRWQEIPTAKLKEYEKILANNMSISDRRVMSEIKASAEARGIAAPEMITAETGTKAMANAPLMKKEWGVTSTPAAVTKNPSARHVILSDYPEDGEGELSRFFKDKPVWGKLAIIGGTIAAQQISAQAMASVFDHFNEAIAKARGAFDARHPDPTQLQAQTGLDRYKQAYETALSRVNRPSGLKAAEAVALAFTKPGDVERVKAMWDAQIAKVVSAQDGTISVYGKVADEYMDAMVALHNQLAAASAGVDAIAADIEKRGTVIAAAGDTLEQAFWYGLPGTLAFPVAYYEWLNVKNTADSFQNLGATVLTFSTYISDRLAAYDALLKKLEDEMLKVSNEVNRFT